LRIFFCSVLPLLSTSRCPKVREDYLWVGADKVHTDVEVLLAQELRHLLGVVEEAHADGNDNDLARREPERPLAGKVLAQNGREALDAAGHGAVDHDGAGAAGGQGLLDEEGLLLAVLLVLGASRLGVLAVSGLGLEDRSGGGGLGVLGLGDVTLGRLKLEGEVDGLLEVELDGGTLP
jgi:hypothetical protein